MASVLIIDDQEDLRFSISKLVKKEGHTVFTAANAEQGLERLRTTIIDLIFLDIGLPDQSGLEIISTIREITSDVDIVILTGINEAKTAVEALRAGAIDYIVKPFDIVEFRSILQRILQNRLMRGRAILESQTTGLGAIIGESQVMHRIKEAIVNAAVLISGETGTGKELAARAIHELRPEPKGLFVKVDCGTLTSNLIESELFGYDQGAFTDARAAKKGLVEMASGGTLFLDEISNLPIELQPKLLRLIEESTFRKVGGLKDITVSVRIIAATNLELKNAIEKGQFREDLYFRLNIIPIPLPPLRQRGDDVVLLADFFLNALLAEIKKNIHGFTPDARSRLLRHSWPGNIRELRNTIEREVLFAKTSWLDLANLETATPHCSTKEEPLLRLEEVERQYIAKVLARVDQNKSKAARILGISRTTLREKLG